MDSSLQAPQATLGFLALASGQHGIGREAGSGLILKLSPRDVPVGFFRHKNVRYFETNSYDR